MAEVLVNLSGATRRLRRLPDDTVGDLFDWYRGGAIAVIAFGGRESQVSPEGAGSTARRHYD